MRRGHWGLPFHGRTRGADFACGWLARWLSLPLASHTHFASRALRQRPPACSVRAAWQACWRALSSAACSWRCLCPTRAAPGTTPRSTSRWVVGGWVGGVNGWEGECVRTSQKRASDRRRCAGAVARGRLPGAPLLLAGSPSSLMQSSPSPPRQAGATEHSRSMGGKGSDCHTVRRALLLWGLGPGWPGWGPASRACRLARSLPAC